MFIHYAIVYTLLLFDIITSIEPYNPSTFATIREIETDTC